MLKAKCEMGEAATMLVEGPIARNRVMVEWVDSWAAVSDAGRERIEEKWSGYMAAAEREGRTLFNGGVTRLVGVRMEGGELRLTLGPTDYKQFVVTTMRDYAWFVENDPGAITPALGNSVLLTNGDRGLLGIRTIRTSAYGGRAHVIGGVLDRLGTEKFPASVEGLIGHLRMELHEEAGVEAGDLVGDPRVLASGRDEFLHQPELVWVWEMSRALEEIGAGLDRVEHEGAIIVEKGGVSETVYRQMTPMARFAWERWQRMA